jgi:hypothetical protein
MVAAPCSQWIACSPVRRCTVAGRSTRSLAVMWKLLALVTALPLLSVGAECTKSQERAALHEAAGLNSWAAVHRSFRRYGHCDDGAIAEGYSESVTVLLAEHWGQLKRLNDHAAGDPKFRAFVIRHINETVPSERLKRITHNAQSKCPRGLRSLCQEVANTSMTANKSLERTVSQRGRTVRAVALCARAGAEWRSWPAAQRNR